MGSRLKFNVLPTLQAGETVLLFKKWLWATSGKSHPNYRVFFSLPPLWEAGLFVTSRRVLVVCHLLRLMTLEASQWYAGMADPADDEVITRLSLGENALLGPFLDVLSTSAETHWYRSPELRMRFYMRNAQDVGRLIAQHANVSEAG